MMSAYNSVNGQFCGENEHLLNEILKTDWGFDGFVLSDWVFGTHTTLGSALNGLDLEMLRAMLVEDRGASIQCHFCNEEYVVPEQRLAEIVADIEGH